jgi:hypothetical protein
VDFGRFNTSPYVSKDMRATLTANGSRTRLAVEAFQTERDYINAVRVDEKGTGAGLTATRSLASNVSADISLAYSIYDRQGDLLDPNSADTSKDKDTQLTFRLNRKGGAHFAVSGEAGYLTRSGDSDYDGWWVALRTRWTP